MENNYAERSVLAHFPSGDSARSAAGELEAAGYHTVQVDRISHYGGGLDDEGGLYTGGGEMTGMTIFSGSGAGDRDHYLVTVVTGEDAAGEVRSILDKYGGR